MALSMIQRLKSCKKTFSQIIVFRTIRISSSLMQDVRVRFAPSPTGELHLGSLRTALYNDLFAKSHNGKFILRIEDTDRNRLVPGAAEKISEVLYWAGIIPDEGPSEGGEYGPYVQSERTEIYQQHVKVLLEKGLAYRCFCNKLRLDVMRKDCIRRGENPRYDGKCRHLTEDEINSKLEEKVPFVIRFKLEPNEDSVEDLVFGAKHLNIAQTEGDPILIKSDNFPTYHFTNVVDDHLMKISHVLRGEEWLSSIPKHVLLFRAFGWEPPRYAHLPNLLGAGAKKLSKRESDVQIKYYQDNFYEPEVVLNFLTLTGGGFGFGTDIKLRSYQDLINNFSISNVVRNSARLQKEKLQILNSMYLEREILTEKKQELIDKARKIVTDFFKERTYQENLSTNVNNNESSGAEDLKNMDLSDDFIYKILKWCIEEGRISRINQLVDNDFQFIWRSPVNLDVTVIKDIGVDVSCVIENIVDYIQNLNDSQYKQEELTTFLKTFSKDKNIKFKNMMTLLRYFMSETKDGPGVTEMMCILGKTRTITRLNNGLKHYMDNS